MFQTKSNIFNLPESKKEKGVYYLSNLNTEFEEIYIKVREKEKRVLTDKQVKDLPNTDSNGELHNEWNLRKETSERFLYYLKRKEFHKVLDIGCGNGWFTVLMAQSYPKSYFVGLDINQKELEQAARLFKFPNVDFVYANIFDELILFHNAFDLITLNASVQYFPDFDKLFKRLVEFLKPNGEIHILDSPFYKKEEIEEAKKRTKSYYKKIGNNELSDFYFHHQSEDIKDFEVLFKPKTRIARRFYSKNKSPFVWIRFINSNQEDSIKEGFSKIAEDYEKFNTQSILINYMRSVVRGHLSNRLSKKEEILEINCGSGLDALFLAKKGHKVVATDIAEGMLDKVKLKIKNHDLNEMLSFKKLSFQELNTFSKNEFSCVFSNFGGLNCIDSLSLNQLIKDASNVLKPNGIITLVIMPKITFYEWLRIFKGDKSAFRRLEKGGVIANVKGEKVKTYYHSAKSVKKMLKDNFTDIQIENIFTLGPSGSSYNFPEKHPTLFNSFIRLDKIFNNTPFFKGFGDYYIISGKKK